MAGPAPSAVDVLVSALTPILGDIADPVSIPSGENSVFRMSSGRCGDVAVRLSPSARRSKAMLDAELELIRALRRRGAPVVAPVDELAPTPLRWDGTEWWVVAFPWVAGVAPAISDVTTLRSWGELLGRIHRVTRRLGPRADRPRWSMSGHFDIRRHLAGWPDDERTAMERAVAVLDALPARMPCHGDLGWANLVWTADGPVAIDFDDCCNAPAAFDVAAAVVDLLIDHGRQLDVSPDTALEALLLGYADAEEGEGGARGAFSTTLDAFVWVLLVERSITARRTGTADPEADERLREALRSGTLPPEVGSGRARFGELFG